MLTNRFVKYCTENPAMSIADAWMQFYKGLSDNDKKKANDVCDLCYDAAEMMRNYDLQTVKALLR